MITSGSPDEEDKITTVESPQSARSDDEDVVIPDTPEPSRGKLRNNRKPSQKLSGKNLEQLFSKNYDVERPGDNRNSDGGVIDTVEAAQIAQ